MQYEVEQKFRVSDFGDIERRLAERGAAIGPPEVQVDSYFAHPCRDFKQTDEALRIRCVGDENRITYKGPKIDPVTKTRKELELPILPTPAGAAQFRELLESLGFVLVADVRKTRRYALLEIAGRSVEICFDNVEHLGAFVEIELTASQQDLDPAREILATLAKEWNLTHNERRSYLGLLLGDE